MNNIVRQLGADDLALARQLFVLFQVAFSEEGGAKPASLPPDSHLTRLLSKDDFHVFVALDGDFVVGGLTAYELELMNGGRELFIYDVAVAKAHRRRGIGSALIKSAQEWIVTRDLSALYVPAMADDAQAVSFYESSGLKREDVAWFVQEFPRVCT